jgi:hypothetical protein
VCVFIYERATEQEYGLDRLPGANVMKRSTAQHASRLARAIIANHDLPVTAHDIAAQTPTAALPHCRNESKGSATAVQRRCNADGQAIKSGKQTVRVCGL